MAEREEVKVPLRIEREMCDGKVLRFTGYGICVEEAHEDAVSKYRAADARLAKKLREQAEADHARDILMGRVSGDAYLGRIRVTR